MIILCEILRSMNVSTMLEWPHTRPECNVSMEKRVFLNIVFYFVLDGLLGLYS